MRSWGLGGLTACERVVLARWLESTRKQMAPRNLAKRSRFEEELRTPQPTRCLRHSFKADATMPCLLRAVLALPAPRSDRPCTRESADLRNTHANGVEEEEMR